MRQGVNPPPPLGEHRTCRSVIVCVRLPGSSAIGHVLGAIDDAVMGKVSNCTSNK